MLNSNHENYSLYSNTSIHNYYFSCRFVKVFVFWLPHLCYSTLYHYALYFKDIRT